MQNRGLHGRSMWGPVVRTVSFLCSAARASRAPQLSVHFSATYSSWVSFVFLSYILCFAFLPYYHKTRRFSHSSQFLDRH